jgi:hypothetical protein
MGTDPIIPIAAEFGEPDKIQSLPTNKALQEVDKSSAFQKEMEKKATTVNEKDRDETRSQANEQHQIDEMKPLIQEAISQEQAKATPELDTPKTTAPKVKEPTQVEDPVTKKSSIITHDTTPGDKPTEQVDHITSKLPDPTGLTKDKVGVEHVAKKMAPPPLTTQAKEAAQTPHVEKKEHTPIQMETTSQQGDTSSKEKQPQVIPENMGKHVEKPTEKTSNLEKSTETQAPKALPPTKEPPLLQKPVEKPQITTHAPTQKTPLSTAPSLTSQEKPIQKEPEVSLAPPPTDTNAKPISPTEEVFKDEPVQVQRPQQAPPGPIEMEQKETPSNSSPFAVPYPVESRKKDDVKGVKEDMQEKDDLTKVQAPSESDGLEKEKKDEGGKQQMAESSQNLLNSLTPDNSIGSDTPFDRAIGFDKLHPQVMQLFDRLVGVITVLQVQGKTETSIQLNDQQFPHLKGTEILVTRFDTASNAYNIELRGPPEAVKILQKDLEGLKKTFSSRKKEFKFEITDITISLKDDTTK